MVEYYACLARVVPVAEGYTYQPLPMAVLAYVDTRINRKNGTRFAIPQGSPYSVDVIDRGDEGDTRKTVDDYGERRGYECENLHSIRNLAGRSHGFRHAVGTCTEPEGSLGFHDSIYQDSSSSRWISFKTKN
jgi:hypothetical protein